MIPRLFEMDTSFRLSCVDEGECSKTWIIVYLYSLSVIVEQAFLGDENDSTDS